MSAMAQLGANGPCNWVRRVVAARRHVWRARERGGAIAAIEHEPIDGFGGPHLVVQRLLRRRQDRRHVPGDFQLLRGLDRIPLERRHDADEVPAADHACARDAADGARINAHHLRAVEERPWPRGRTTRPCSMPGTLMCCR